MTTPPAMPLKTRTTLALAITALTIVPALVMVAIAYVGTGHVQAAATWASLPAIAGIVAAAAGGRRFAIIATIVMAFLAPLSIVAGLSPVSGAALMALSCMVIGRLARFGLHKSAILVPIMMAWPLIDPPAWSGAASVDRTDNAYLLWMAVIFLVGGIIPALVVPLAMRKRPHPAPVAHSQSEAVTYTVMITILVAVSTYYVLNTPTMYGGAFLVAAILVLAPLGTAQTLMPTVVRVLSTVAGSVLVLAMVSQVHSLAIIYLIGVLLIVIALIARFSRQMWLYYAFMVPATASLNATSLAQVGQLGEQRVVDNLVGGVMVLLASAIAISYANWAQRHGRAEDRDHEASDAAGALVHTVPSAPSH